jgi:hypothetical protein
MRDRRILRRRGRTPMGQTAYHHLGQTANHHLGYLVEEDLGDDPSSASSTITTVAPATASTAAAPTPTTTSGPQILVFSDPSSDSYGSPTDGFWPWARMALVGLAAFHGYRRNQSVGWAIAWAALAELSPAITIGVAFAEGFGAPKGR